jgi:hypothetical protein
LLYRVIDDNFCEHLQKDNPRQVVESHNSIEIEFPSFPSNHHHCPKDSSSMVSEQYDVNQKCTHLIRMAQPTLNTASREHTQASSGSK